MAKTKTKIEVQLSGEDGNVFAIIGAVRNVLRKAGHKELAVEFRDKAFKAASYEDVLNLCREYVEIN